MSDEPVADGLVIVRPSKRFVDPKGQTVGMRREGGVTPETSGAKDYGRVT